MSSKHCFMLVPAYIEKNSWDVLAHLRDCFDKGGHEHVVDVAEKGEEAIEVCHCHSRVHDVHAGVGSS